MSTTDLLRTHRLVPVVVIDDPGHADHLATALADGGLPLAEVTFRTAAAAAAIGRMRDHGGVTVGAGTVLTAKQVDVAVDAGAEFVVSPGFSRAVVERCAEHGVLVVPGAGTPTEIMTALDAGLDLVKFFPAETSGGVPAVSALSAPFPQVSFVPTGGITGATAADYLALPAVAAVGGSWMVPRDLVRGGDVEALTALVRASVSAVSISA
jgi:2-dehydro-3-deoxyphosphogluconate aldolase/(4S)-4-hydroxy-2-oxoglutarate aldolase